MFRRLIGCSFLAAACLLPLLVCAGCSSTPVASAPDQAASPEHPHVDRVAAEKAEAVALASVLNQIAKEKTDYRISPADLIDVTVYQDADLTRKVRVSANGTISMPLIGAVKIGGLTVIEAESELAEKLRRYLVNPQISLFIEEYGNKQIYVLGEVNKPGAYPIPTESRLTVLEAISTAGGFTPIAGVDRTRVLRNVNGKNDILMIDVTAITKRGEKEKDIPLQPNDVVYVPQSFF